jgi:hypothetical protein
VFVKKDELSTVFLENPFSFFVVSSKLRKNKDFEGCVQVVRGLQVSLGSVFSCPDGDTILFKSFKIKGVSGVLKVSLE